MLATMVVFPTAVVAAFMHFIPSDILLLSAILCALVNVR
jgi:hypothetical protein